jgi:hypothetical protein
VEWRAGTRSGRLGRPGFFGGAVAVTGARTRRHRGLKVDWRASRRSPPRGGSRPVARFKLPFSAKKLESHDSQRVSTVAASEVVAVGTLACWIARWVGSVPTMIGSERSRSPSVSPTTSSSAPTTESHGASHSQASGRHSRSVTASPLPGQRRRTRRRSGRSDRRSTSGETTLAADRREEIEEIFSG